MATGGFGMGTAPAPAATNLLEQKLRAEAAVKAAAGWFLWVAALSMVNSFLSMSGSGIRFIFGLGARLRSSTRSRIRRAMVVWCSSSSSMALWQPFCFCSGILRAKDRNGPSS